MPKSGSGKGISDAVRANLQHWMTDKVIDIMLKTPTPTSTAVQLKTGNGRAWFRQQLRDSEQWSRIVRKKDPNTGVYKRTYYSKLFGKDGPGLTVLTNKAGDGKEEDMYIEYVTITMGKSVIGGGKVFIPSVKLSQLGRKATIQDFQTQSIFAEFTEKELARLSAELEFGEDGVLLMLESERYD